MQEASKNKQIIISTHNPEVIKHTKLENILFISRNNYGFSTILKSDEIEHIKAFLQNEIGIEELFIKNLLERK